MSTQTTIEWTDVTDNIIVAKGGGWWCRMISELCGNCYAAALNQSDYFGGNHLPYTGEPPELELRTELIDGWARQRNPKKHFVASMTDVFGEWVPRDWVFRFLDGMQAACGQTFQVLTKRPEIARQHIEGWLLSKNLPFLPGNIWIGASMGAKELAGPELDSLKEIRARMLFLSLEPLLEQVDLKKALGLVSGFSVVDWVIVGGESGPKARPCHLDWVRDVVKQCKAAGVSVFVKQLGKRAVHDMTMVIPEADINDESLQPEDIAAWEHGRHNAPMNLKHPKGGDWNEWPVDVKVRDFPVPF